MKQNLFKGEKLQKVNIMKNPNTLPPNLLLRAILILFAAVALLTTPQDTLASVDKITLTSDAGDDNTYNVGDRIEATVKFTGEVNVESSEENAEHVPQLTLKIGTANRIAAFDGRKSQKELAFAYTVAVGDLDTDGIEIEANNLTLNGGKITDTTSGRSADLKHAALPAQTSHKVDGVAPTITTTGIAITSTPTSNNTYKIGDKIQATVTFSESVNVTGTPQLTLKIGTAGKNANYKSGTGTTALVFEYTVVANDVDTDGIEIEANKLTLNSGTIKDLAGNAATLTHTALSAQTSHKVDGVAPTIATNGIAITNAPAGNNTYKISDKIQATVTFSENVTVTGTPQLTLKIGTADKNAAYTSGSGTTALTFAYTIISGDADTDGIEIAANKLTLNSGTIKDPAGNAAILTHTALSAQTSPKVDGVVPTITKNGVSITSTATNNNTYKIGDRIQATVTFSENVNVTGTPQLTLKIGTADKNAAYTSGSGTTALIFAYTVATGDTDTNGISIAANALALNSGTIGDAAGNNAVLTYTALPNNSSHKVDAIAPKIPIKNGKSAIRMNSKETPYGIGAVFQTTVEFTENVVVTGTPQLELLIGPAASAAAKQANYASGSGTTVLVFEYTVVAGETDPDGVFINKNALTLNNGTIKDTVGNDAVLWHHSAPGGPARKIDGIIPKIALNGVAFTSTTAHYTAGEVIQTTVTFSENVIVTGTPQLALQIGTDTKNVDYTSGTGTTALVFAYTVVTGDTDADGISIAANALSLNGGTIKDAAGNAAVLKRTAMPDNASHKVDTTIPEIVANGVAITSTTAHYTAGEVIQATVTFSENVIVTGTPQLAVQIGSVTKLAGYASGSGTTALVFAYTVVAGDTDADGISIAANALSLNSGTIGDAAENAAVLTHTAVSADSAHQVDTTSPSINSIAFTSTTAPYTAGEVVRVTVTFNEKVFVTGTPRLPLQFSVLKKPATYTWGSGTAALVFEYTVVAGEMDADGISIDADALTLNGGTIKDAIGNNANLTHTALPAQPAHIVDTEKPRINALRITSTPTNNTYKTGDSIEVTVDWSKAVTVTGSPTIALSMEREIRTLSYKSGSGSKALVFSYTVTAGDTDETGISIQAGQIALGDGIKIIQQGETTAAILTHSGLPDYPSHKVDTTAPKIVSNGVTITSTSAPYTTTEVIQVIVTFTENVLVTGTPQLALQIGTATKTAAYTSGTGTTALVFEYTVVAGEADTDGISIAANALSLNSGTIKDAAGNNAVLTHTALPNAPAHKVNSIKPTITTNGIAITSTPTSNSIYTKDDVIQATVTFSENVDVTGTPQLTLRIGTADKNANYTSGTGTTVLVFEYTVVASDVDADGIEIRADKLTLNGGTLQDAAGNAATLTYNALPAQASHKVDGTVPAINGIAITSAPASNNTYKTGDKIQATVTFTENMKVTGTPQLAIQIGNTPKTANYASGSSTAALVFEYTVVAGDTDANGISIAANALTLNSGTIKDTTGSAAVLTHTAVSDDSSHQVDSTQPNIVANGVTITSTTAPYIADEVLQATVTFTENVFVTGTPQLTLKIGSTTKTANYASGTGTTALVFEYTVVTGDTDADGISIAANALSLNSGTIKDAAGNAAILTHGAVSDDSSHQVDGIQPNIVANGVTITSTTAPYTAGEVIQATVTFTENVIVTGTPQLTLQISNATKVADYASGTGTAALVFEYTVVTGDMDADGISIAANALTLNSGTIKDAAGNAAPLTHTAVSNNSSHQVDGIQPNIVANGIAITSTTAPYMEGEVVQATVTFTENVIVTGAPQLAIQIGSATKKADYTSGTGTPALVFEYTVVTGDTDADGFSIAANALTLNSGTIKDAAGNNAGLTHTGVPASASYKVDAVQPALSSIQITSSAGDDATYMLGNVIQISMTMSEAVNVTGTPKLTLTIGTQNRLADYQSGGGTATLKFAYTVVAGDMDTDGISIPNVPFNLNGASITDIVGNPLPDAPVPNQPAITDQIAHKVDTDPPRIVSGSSDGQGTSGAVGFARAFNAAVVSNGVEITSSGPYGTGDIVQITVTFSESVRVTGTPEIQLQIGGTTKNVGYQSGSSTDEITFTYTIVSGDADVDGISIRANSIQLNGGSIKDIPGNLADLKHSEVSAASLHIVDTTLLKISSLAFSSTGWAL